MPPEPSRPTNGHILPLDGATDLRDHPAAGRPASLAASIEPLLLTRTEAARLLAVSERTLWTLTDRGEVPCVRLGRNVRYDRRDLMAYIDRLRGK